MTDIIIEIMTDIIKTDSSMLHQHYEKYENINENFNFFMNIAGKYD